MKTEEKLDGKGGEVERPRNSALDTQKAWEVMGDEGMERITQAARAEKRRMDYLGSKSTIDLACDAAKRLAVQVDTGRFDHPSDSKEFSSYIRKTIKNIILDSLKAARNRLREHSDVLSEVAGPARGEDQLVSAVTLERVQERIELFFAGEGELGGAYTPDEREQMKHILVLSVDGGLSNRDIATRLNISHQTVSRRLQFLRTQVLADFHEESRHEQ